MMRSLWWIILVLASGQLATAEFVLVGELSTLTVVIYSLRVHWLVAISIARVGVKKTLGRSGIFSFSIRVRWVK